MQEERPLISIIVPFYNANYTLDRCMDSIQNQTFSPIEIIMVDNNSTDEGRKIVERRAKTDDRIRLLFCETPGPAAARNMALAECKGEWVMFVDHDDVLAVHAVETLYGLARSAGVEFVCGSYYLCNEDFSSKKYRKLPAFESFDKEKTHSFFLHQGLNYNHAWGKLYKKTIFDNYRYVEERFYEDITALPYILEKAKGCAVTSEPIYFYIQQKTNISYSGSFYQQVDGLSARMDNCAFYKKHYPALEKTAYDAALQFAFYLLGRIYRNELKDNRKMWDQVSATIRFITKKAARHGVKIKAALLLFKINDVFAAKLFNLYSTKRNG